MEPIKVENLDMKQIIKSGHSYIEVSGRKFLLLEVENAQETDCYKVTDPVEEEELLKALNETTPY